MEKPLDKPTDLFPGTPEKIEVLARRYREGFELHHDDDKKIDWESYAPRSEMISLKGMLESWVERIRDEYGDED